MENIELYCFILNFFYGDVMSKILIMFFCFVFLIGCGGEQQQVSVAEEVEDVEVYNDPFMSINFDALYSDVTTKDVADEIKVAINNYIDEVKNTRMKYEEERNYSKDVTNDQIKDKKEFHNEQYDLKTEECLTIESDAKQKVCDEIEAKIDVAMEEVSLLHESDKENMRTLTALEIEELKDRKELLQIKVNEIREKANLQKIDF